MENQLSRPLTFHPYGISHNKVLYVYEVYMYVHVYSWLLFHSTICWVLYSYWTTLITILCACKPISSRKLSYLVWKKFRFLHQVFKSAKTESKNKNENNFPKSKESSWTQHVSQLIELMQPFKNYAHLYKKMIVLLFGLMQRD